jgi:hypothetical protein
MREKRERRILEACETLVLQAGGGVSFKVRQGGFAFSVTRRPQKEI